ncbi:condensation domain-containing protein [Aspergillus granulosus]|uniref:Condensation domain-containing protein n=1 Tax=Aspergillus granulosus TaxID=176169 RepID=A0ABR4GSK2_9EURO
MQLSALLHTEGFLLSVSEIFQNNTLSQTALSLTRERETVLSTEESVNAQFDLSPIQRLFFDLAPAGPNDFHMSFLIPVAETITSPDIIRAINNIVQHHSMLRARFCKTSDNTWTQFVTPDVESSYRFQKSTATSLSGAADLIHASQHSLDIKNGPLFSVDLIETPVLQQYLYLLAHHLIVDMVSWRIILGDLEELLKGGRLPICKPLPFQTWCRLQAEYSIAYLTPEKAMPFRVPVIPIDYWGEIKHQNTPKDTLYSSFSVSKEVTIALFGQANDTLQTQPVEILQAAIWHSFVHTFPARAPPVIFNAGHGREPWHTDIDLSRTVGWFTTMWPTYLEPHGRDEDIVEVIRRTKDTRRRTPNNGWAYFTSRFINPYGQAEFKIDMPVEITFNYLGMYQQLERVDAILQSPVRLDNLVPYMVSDVPRFSLIDVYVTVEHGCLQFDFYYNRHMKHLDAIGRWFARCHESLLEAADRLLGMDSISTPSNS